jgi:hypothetical protein
MEDYGMKSVYKAVIVFALIITALLAFPNIVLADSGKPGDGNVLIIGKTYLLKSGEVRNNDLLIMGGAATLEEGSTINGDILLLNSSLDVYGNVNGTITSIGSSLNMGDSAVVNGDVIAPLSDLARAEKAVISGEVIVQPAAINIHGSGLPRFYFYPWISMPQWYDLGTLFRISRDIISSLLLAGLAALIVMLFPRPAERVLRTITSNPFGAGGMGCLTFIVIIFLAILLGITIILLPVSIIGIIILIFAALYGWFILGLELGKRLEILFKINWAPPVSAGLGVLILTLVLMAVNNWVNLCCLGVPVIAVLASVGLGGVVMAIFGGGKQPPASYQSLRPVPSVTPAPIISPVVNAVPPVPAEEAITQEKEMDQIDEPEADAEAATPQEDNAGIPFMSVGPDVEIPDESSPQVSETPPLKEK